MACNQISAVTYTCLQNTGGVRKVYITNYSNITGSTANAIGTLTAVGLASGTYFEEFQFNRDTSSIEEDATVNLENGTTFYTQTVNLVIPRRDASKRDKILVLATGQPLLAVIVQDQNLDYWFVGYQNGAYLTQNKTGSGTKKSDSNAYHLTIVAEEPTLANNVDSAIIDALTR